MPSPRFQVVPSAYLVMLREASGPGVRVDSGIHQGQRVGSDFDPLLSKLIVHGRDRREAIARARQALRDTALLGVTTNTAYLDRVLGHPQFAAGDYSTAFLDEQAGQCGYCLSGILISASALLAKNRKPSRADIIAALDPHLCRCGIHNRVVRAVQKAAAMMPAGAQP